VAELPIKHAAEVKDSEKYFLAFKAFHDTVKAEQAWKMPTRLLLIL